MNISADEHNFRQRFDDVCFAQSKPNRNRSRSIISAEDNVAALESAVS